jgi:hypothetical protein
MMDITPRQAEVEPVSVASVRDDVVVLDVGDVTGALVLYTAPGDADREIHLHPVTGGASTHNVVRERRMGRSLTHAAIFPSLEAGTYMTDPPPHADSGKRVEVVGGAVVEVTWSR